MPLPSKQDMIYGLSPGKTQKTENPRYGSVYRLSGFLRMVVLFACPTDDPRRGDRPHMRFPGTGIRVQNTACHRKTAGQESRPARVLYSRGEHR